MEKNLKIQVPQGYEIDKEKSSFENIVFKEISKVDKNKEMSEFLYDILKETRCKITGEKQVVFYDKNDNWLIQQDYKNGFLWVNYDRIWLVFQSKFGLNYQEIKEFMTSWMDVNLGWKGLTPRNQLTRSITCIVSDGCESRMEGINTSKPTLI